MHGLSCPSSTMADSGVFVGPLLAEFRLPCTQWPGSMHDPDLNRIRGASERQYISTSKNNLSSPAPDKEKMNPKLSVKEVFDHTKKTIDELFMSYGSAAGSIGILKDGKRHFLNVGAKEALGISSAPEEGANDEHTAYLISSMTKPIIALAVGIMVSNRDYGVSLDTPVKDIITELKGKTFLRHARRELTIADLLDHRAEFIRCTNLWETPDGHIPWQTMDPVISLLKHLPPSEKFKRAEDFIHARNYSNEGFALAAAIIEKTTGMSWPKFVEEKVLDPLEMYETWPSMSDRQARGQNQHHRVLAPRAQGRPPQQMAGSYSVLADRTIRALQADYPDEGRLGYAKIHKHVGSKAYYPPTYTKVPRCKAGWARDGTCKSTPIGAAAGMLSSVDDLLKLYAVLLQVFGATDDSGKSGMPNVVGTDDDKQSLLLNRSRRELKQLLECDPVGQSPSLREVYRGMATVKEHIYDMMQADETCAYAAGWNTIGLPWSPEHVVEHAEKPHAVNQQRWPGADGDNARRFERAMKALGKNDIEASREWRFFQESNSGSTANTSSSALSKLDKGFRRDNNKQQPQQNLALYHGGNMVGATSFCMLLPTENMAVVVLCDTRGFFLDAANMTGMLLADCLFRGSLKNDVEARCKLAREMARHIAASYLHDVLAYNWELSNRYVEAQTVYTTEEMTALGKACSGTYQLTEHVFVEVLLVTGLRPPSGAAMLKIRLYGRGRAYVLRLADPSERFEDAISKGMITMCFAAHMDDALLATGVGGNNRLHAREFMVTFRTAAARGGKDDHQFPELVWDFERGRTGPDPQGHFTFRRVPGPLTKIAWGDWDESKPDASDCNFV
ncbi:beta-lactamase/transpeptidase-like protein [Diplogelasinospora grovesii]|uniref:Beta-lactamase/transpeptidase-like protein n=1 Tax=Diplogelasinospora grovesii TaxID=303347 RepID=A0AAN6NAZ5_9PEZI|nr:beta-lactamase/transpeptidase-like protein [Diplogelasinospora grovesii]